MGLVLAMAALSGPAAGIARADSAPANPSDPATPPTVTGDQLPTVQINGVAWSQVVVGNTVYVAGSFTSARPAGAAAGTSETPRNNLLAYDIRTGQLITSFAPNLNAQALVVTASPDGSRIYVGGDFTTADGQTRNRVAAYDTATGALVPGFHPSVGGRVRAIAATDSTVYLGGMITSVGSAVRNRLAAVSASNGAVLPWAPVPGVGPTSGNKNGSTQTSNEVMALLVTGGGSQVVAGGRFDSLNGIKATGIGALDPVSGATRPFAVNSLITNQGVNSAVYSLSTDGSTVYGTAYDYYGPGNLESAFAADPNGGALKWASTCRGDTYSSFPVGKVLYISSHAHDCGNIGSFPEQNPRVNKFATAFTTTATGVNGPFTFTNTNFAGKPAPSLLPWFPDLQSGTYTGQSQAGWSVSGNSQYVVYGGEFPKVNGVPQQGLVRFAVPSIAPNKRSPLSTGFTAGAVSLGAGTARVGWTDTSDMDNENLVYRVYRDGNSSTPVYQTNAATQWWNRQQRAFTDTGLAGGTHTYQVSATDPFGNVRITPSVSVSVTAGSTASRAYVTMVKSDGASSLWSLGEKSGSTAYDRIGSADLTVNSGVSRGVAGAIHGDSDTASSFNGTSSGFAATKQSVVGPQQFSVEAWFQTTSKAGGKIIGFGNAATGTSTAFDRHVYMDTSGRLVFGVYTGSTQMLTSSRSYNDGKWHHVVGTLGGGTLALYVDGQLVGSRTGFTVVQPMNGYWRIGGDHVWGTGSYWFAGKIDEAAVYPVALTSGQVSNHYTAGTTGVTPDIAPTASFTSSVDGLTASFDGSASSDPDGSVTGWSWTFGDGTKDSGRTVTHTYAAAGTYGVTLTVTDDRGATGTYDGTVTVTTPPPNVAPTARFTMSGSGLTADFDGSGSSDSDGSVTGYTWDFGDGATGSGVTASHTYTAAGTYTVRLTVTDDAGATGTAQQSVTLPLGYASDGFERTVTSGLGQADLGGTWTVSGGTASVSGGAGHLQIATAGGSSLATLSSVSATDLAEQVQVSLDSAPTGGGTYVALLARRTGSTYYRGVLKFLADGRVSLSITRVVSGTETGLGSLVLPGVTYSPGTSLQVRLDASGSGTTTLAAKAWLTGTPEPAGWQVTASDSTAALQASGAVGVWAYVSGSATTLPVRVNLDQFWAGPSGTAPQAG